VPADVLPRLDHGHIAAIPRGSREDYRASRGPLLVMFVVGDATRPFSSPATKNLGRPIDLQAGESIGVGWRTNQRSL
jgi:hypothetical protein